MTFPETQLCPEWNVMLCMDELSGWYIAQTVCVGSIFSFVFVFSGICDKYNPHFWPTLGQVTGGRLTLKLQSYFQALVHLDMRDNFSWIDFVFNFKASLWNASNISYSHGIKGSVGRFEGEEYQSISSSITLSFVSPILASLHSHTLIQ